MSDIGGGDFGSAEIGGGSAGDDIGGGDVSASDFGELSDGGDFDVDSGASDASDPIVEAPIAEDTESWAENDSSVEEGAVLAQDSAGESDGQLPELEDDVIAASGPAVPDFVLPRAANDDVAGLRYDPSDGIPVLGRLPDTKLYKDREGYTIFDPVANPNANEVWQKAYGDGEAEFPPGWTPDLNKEYVADIVGNGAEPLLATEPVADNLWDDKRKDEAVYAVELDQLKAAGYTQGVDYEDVDRLRPPDLE